MTTIFETDLPEIGRAVARVADILRANDVERENPAYLIGCAATEIELLRQRAEKAEGERDAAIARANAAEEGERQALIVQARLRAERDAAKG